jgi:DNA-binding PadR family transcriptional regulator
MTGELREPTFLILAALAAGPKHGYAILSDAAEMSDGRVKLRTGTLYAVLDRLRANGLVVVDRDEIVDSRHRRYYRLTEDGSRVLAAEAQRMRRNADVAITRLGPAWGT